MGKLSVTPGAGIGRLAAMALLASGLTAAIGPAQADDFTGLTTLIDLHQGSSLSVLAESLGNGGYELSDHTWVSFRPWYTARWLDLQVEFLTQLDADNGILWGFSTGEWGEKYVIAPGLKLGVIVQAHPSPQTTLTLTAESTVLGGSLTELPCVADYGDIGGIQTVNCRLAASELAPEDTLQYLVKADPSRFKISITFAGHF